MCIEARLVVRQACARLIKTVPPKLINSRWNSQGAHLHGADRGSKGLMHTRVAMVWHL